MTGPETLADRAVDAPTWPTWHDWAAVVLLVAIVLPLVLL